MGGNALKHLGVERLPHNEYLPRLVEFKRVVDSVNQKLSTPLMYAFPYELKGKDSYGDLDVIVYHNDPEMVFELLQNAFNSKGYFREKNSTCWSVEWNCLQVDLNWVNSLEELQWQKLWYSHGELSSFMGRVFRHYGFKFAHTSLTFPMTYKTLEKKFVVTHDYKKALKMMGYHFNMDQSYTLNDTYHLACQTEYLPDELTFRKPTENDMLFNQVALSYREFVKNTHKTSEVYSMLWNFDKMVFVNMVFSYLDMVKTYHYNKLRRFYRKHFGKEAQKWKTKNAQK